MKLGVFSLRMSVKNLQLSKDFYENLGSLIFKDPDGNIILIDQHR
jgi:predicted lactoylglutathione lyase